MNKTPVAVAISAAAYSMLFFKENAGLNFLLFNTLVIGLFFWSKPVLRLDRKFIIAALLTLFTSVFIVIHGSDLSIFANAVSLLILSASAVSPQASVINNLVQGVCAVATAALLSFVGLFTKKSDPAERSGRRLSGVITYLVPVFLGFIFLALYRRANPLFERFTANLNLDFISLHWVLFTLGGIVICCGFFLLQRQKGVDALEHTLDNAGTHALPSSVWNQKHAFILLLILLNTMALAINALDVKYLYMGAGLPEGITHKQFVHKGVGNLILSILLGIITLIYFLKRTDKNPLISTLVLMWIGQNFMIVLSTAMRNNMYIQDALLTYKRLGVYYWLFMAGVGLVTTIIKVQRGQNTWYLFRTNAMIAWVVLALSTAIDWDNFISRFNVTHRGSVASLDKKYMLSISEDNLAMLYSIRDDRDFNTDSVWHYNFGGNAPNRELLDAKLYHFLYDNLDTDWRSFNMRRTRVFEEVEELRNKGMFRHFSVAPIYGKFDAKALGFLPDIEWLKLDRLPSPEQLKMLDKLPYLDSLYVVNLSVTDTADLRLLRHIKYIEHEANSSVTKRLEEKIPGITFRRNEEKETKEY